MRFEWIKCPCCGYRHFLKVGCDTVLINHLAFCRRCKTETQITYLNNTVMPEHTMPEHNSH